MENTQPITGPWRATRLWNDIIRTMRAEMPTRKHKKNLKTFENCFSSSEAIEWLHKNLQKNSNFGSDVTREQTVQLLSKLARAGIIENVRDDEVQEFREGELYRLSNKSPVRNIRTPGKVDKKDNERAVLSDVGNTPRRNLREEFREDKSDLSSVEGKERAEKARKEENVRRKRDSSRGRKAKEEAVKKQLNLSYFQSLPSNSLIILDNDSTWRRVFCTQLANSLSPHHVKLLEEAELLDIERVMHNMTRVSSKGIVQLDDKQEDLPHWVLSAMKCLANWPRQLRTVNGKESCLPSYPGFEQDVFNVVKDYFLGLKEPLTTFSLYDYFLDAWVKAEAVAALPRYAPPVLPVNYYLSGATPLQSNTGGCHVHPGSATRTCTRPYTQTDLDNVATEPQFYTMSDTVSEDFMMMSNQERTAKIKATFSCLPPLATSSVKTNNSTNSASTFQSGHTTLSSNSTSTSLTPDMSTTAIMRTFLPPNSCFETVFMESSPVTRIVPQAETETLHFSRSGSSRSLSHIHSNYTRTAGTQTDTETDSQMDTTTQTTTSTKSESLKRVPKWKRSSRLRKSIAVMESQDAEGGIAPTNTPALPVFSPCKEEDSRDLIIGRDNPGYSSSPTVRQVFSTSSLPSNQPATPLQPSNSLDNLLERERDDKNDFLLKYRQVSGDLRASQDLMVQAREEEEKMVMEGRGRSFSLGHSSTRQTVRDRSVIESKTVRKEKRKSKLRDLSHDKGTGLTPALRKVKLERESYCYTNMAMDTSNDRLDAVQGKVAPLASQECDLSPVPTIFNRHTSYNTSYRMATNHPSTPSHRLPRTSTKLSLGRQEMVNVRAEPYKSQRNVQVEPTPQSQEPLYTVAGPGPLKRFSVPQPTLQQSTHTLPHRKLRHSIPPPLSSLDSLPPSLSRNSARASLYSHTTQDSGHYSQVSGRALARSPSPTGMFKLLALLIPPSNRRRLQLLLKFILKISSNSNLSLDNSVTNASLAISIFLEVILRPANLSSHNRDLAFQILQYFLDHYEQVWSPPQDLRREVEEQVYRSLVNKRLEAGEDPYPVTYCEQVTKEQYERSKLTGSQAALKDLLDTILKDEKMGQRNKRKKLKKFKEAYPDMWRNKFPSQEGEPDLLGNNKEKSSKMSSWSKMKSVIGM